MSGRLGMAERFCGNLLSISLWWQIDETEGDLGTCTYHAQDTTGSYGVTSRACIQPLRRPGIKHTPSPKPSVPEAQVSVFIRCDHPKS